MSDTDCTYDPRTANSAAQGMYHCPECGEMVLAGIEHPNMKRVDEDYGEYLDAKYAGLLSYIFDNTDRAYYEAFELLLKSHPKLCDALMEIWLHADMNEEYKCAQCSRPTCGRYVYCGQYCSAKADLESRK